MLRSGLVLTLMLAVACGAPAPEPAPPKAPPAATLSLTSPDAVVLAGNWFVHEEAGESLLRVDGSEWKTGTPPVDLTAKARALFPQSAEAFEERVLAGLQFPTVVMQSVETFGDGDLSVDFRLIGGASDQYASLLFGMTPDANHYAYRYNTKDGDAALWKVVDGQRERLHHGGVPISVPLGEWRTLRLRVQGTQLTGWVNDTLALEFTLPAPVRGRIGLWSKADSITDYRNLQAGASGGE